MERNRISLFYLLIASPLISCMNVLSNTLVLEFQVKTTTDAHVLLSSCERRDGYEVVIGGWSNTKSVIREKKQGDPKVAVKVGLEKKS